MKKLKFKFESLGSFSSPCPGCGEDHASDQDYCTNCGIEVYDTPGTPRQIFTCPDCQQETHNANAVMFSYCGHCKESKEEKVMKRIFPPSSGGPRGSSFLRQG